jgi:hypothetical protein
METVGIVDFLMKVEMPAPQIKASIVGAMQWLVPSKIRGFKYVDVEDKTQPKDMDRVLVKDDVSTVWARFYDIETNKPFFSGRDGIKRWNLGEIEIERRTGYAWYITTPQKLLNKLYPEWQKKNGTVTAKKFSRFRKMAKGTLRIYKTLLICFPILRRHHVQFTLSRAVTTKKFHYKA